MSAAETQEVKNFLLHSDQQFRQLAEQHHDLDDRLHQLIDREPRGSCARHEITYQLVEVALVLEIAALHLPLRNERARAMLRIEHSVAPGIPLVHTEVFRMHVPDRASKITHRCAGIDSLPEQVTRIEVRSYRFTACFTQP